MVAERLMVKYWPGDDEELMMAKLKMVGSLLGMGLTVKQVYLLASTDTLNTSSGPGTEKQTMIFLDVSTLFI